MVAERLTARQKERAARLPVNAAQAAGAAAAGPSADASASCAVQVEGSGAGKHQHEGGTTAGAPEGGAAEREALAAWAAAQDMEAGPMDAAAPTETAVSGEGVPVPGRQQLLPAPPAGGRRAPQPCCPGMLAWLGRLATRRPRLVHGLVLVAIAATACGTSTLLIPAVNFVDASVVQLIGMFTCIAIALIQRLLLGYALPLALWPAAVVMVGGAAMILAPSISRGFEGSSSPPLGCALAATAMLLSAIFFVVGPSGLAFRSAEVQYAAFGGGILVLLPLSLAIDGADWGDTSGWPASSWAILVLLGTAFATWALSAPTVSMFLGLRLVFTIAMSKTILGATVIQTGVQVGGVVVTATS
eukprot:scaffold1.g5855.t1